MRVAFLVNIRFSQREDVVFHRHTLIEDERRVDTQCLSNYVEGQSDIMLRGMTDIPTLSRYGNELSSSIVGFSAERVKSSCRSLD